MGNGRKITGYASSGTGFCAEADRRRSVGSQISVLFGEYVTESQERTWKHLQELPAETLQKMADTYTEGYRIGFEVGNKDISIKKQ